MQTLTETAYGPAVDPRDRFTWNLQPVYPEHTQTLPAEDTVAPPQVVPFYPGRDGVRRPQADHSYLYAPAQLDGVCGRATVPAPTRSAIPAPRHPGASPAATGNTPIGRAERWQEIYKPLRTGDGMPLTERGTFTEPTEEETGEIIDLWRRAGRTDAAHAKASIGRVAVWDSKEDLSEAETQRFNFVQREGGIVRHRRESRTWKAIKRTTAAVGRLAIAVSSSTAATSLVHQHEPASFWSAIFG